MFPDLVATLYFHKIRDGTMKLASSCNSSSGPKAIPKDKVYFE